MNQRLLFLFIAILLTHIDRKGLAMENQNSIPDGFVPLFNGHDLNGWYGWGTQDPDDFRNMSPEEKLEYKTKSIHGGLLN
ncbi:MAG: DUF1080 domain-containing protein, partial [Pirellulales bacterium]|nr:DUF1080 domain-containing protein [Pirellulales bacterium]